MHLSQSNRVALTTEIRTAVDYMSKAVNEQQKLYFFSAVFGMANRIVNMEFDPELAFLHSVVQAAHSTINTNLLLMAQGQAMRTLPPDLFEKLQDTLGNLADLIEQGRETYPALERISNLAYSTTGNGYYLFVKGMLTI